MAKMSRRNSVMAAVKKALKAQKTFIPKDQLQKIAEAIDTSVYYYIEVMRSADEVGEHLCLRNCTGENLESGVTETAKTIFGRIKYCSYVCSPNDFSVIPGEFHTSESFAFIHYRHRWDEFSDEEFNTIVIYAP